MPGKMVASEILNGRLNYFPDLPACDSFVHIMFQRSDRNGHDPPGVNQLRGPSSLEGPVRSSRRLPLRVEELSDASFLSRRFLRW